MRLSVCLALLALLAAGCDEFQLKSAWCDREVRVDGFDHEWGGVEGLKAEGVTVQAMNDAHTLYLCLSADSGWAKRQLLGLFHQDLLLWFAPMGSEKARLGLRASLVPSLYVAPPYTLRDEKPYMDAAARQLSFLKPGSADYPRPLAMDSKEAAFAADDEHGLVCWELAVALQSDAKHAFALDAKPGQTLLFGLQATPIHALDGSGGPQFRPGHRRHAVDAEMMGPQPVELWGDLTLAAQP